MTAGRLAAAALAVLVLAGPAWAKEPEVTDEMKRLCPGLDSAVGRQHDQLLLLYFRLDPTRAADAAQQEKVRAAFDPRNAEDAALLRRELFEPEKLRCLAGLKVVYAALGAPGALLLVKEYAAAADDPLRRARAIEGLQGCAFVQVDRLLHKALADRASINDKGAQLAPPGYEPKRVCDYAFRVLCVRLDGPVKTPKGLLSGAAVGPMTPATARDERIGAFVAWAEKDAGLAAFFKGRASLLAGLNETEAAEAREALEKAGVQAE